MIKQYRSLYPNHVHQLAVSVSKHFYVSKSGLLKYQKKAFDIKLENIHNAEKNHLIVYSLRDHCSGLYYVEIAFKSDFYSVQSFLYRAWKEKSGIAFCGLPDCLMIPNTVQKVFPDTSDEVIQQGVELVPVTSGFQSGGLIAIKAVEQHLLFHIDTSVDCLQDVALRTYRYNANEYLRGTKLSKENTWLEHVKSIRFPSDDFCRTK